MYSEWASLKSNVVRRNSGLSEESETGCDIEDEEKSVLCKFGSSAGKQVVVAVVKHLASNLGITSTGLTVCNLNCDKDVLWCMEVIGYGLTLPLQEHDTVRDCVHVYCDWLSTLYIDTSNAPSPVRTQPNYYARRIIAHLYNLFVPRNGQGSDLINKQAVLCHRVLRTIQQVAHTSETIDYDTWNALHLFLLQINDALLAPPTRKDDVGEQLCERVLSVLLEVWLTACCRASYPSPSLWRTLREVAAYWRHRTPLVEQWNRVNLVLTYRLLQVMYSPDYPNINIGQDDLLRTANKMSEECVAQTWFRMLHTIGNPVELSRPELVGRTPHFLQYALGSANPAPHACLAAALPVNFYKAMRGIACLVDAFLGLACEAIALDEPDVAIGAEWDDRKKEHEPKRSPTPVPRRRLAKSFSSSSSTSFATTATQTVTSGNTVMTKGLPRSSIIGLTTSRISSMVSSATQGAFGSSVSSSASSLSSQATITATTAVATAAISSHHSIDTTSIDWCGSEMSEKQLNANRPKCNSILHLFGEWLFEASYKPVPCSPPFAAFSNDESQSLASTSSCGRTTRSSMPSSLSETETCSIGSGPRSQPSSLTESEACAEVDRFANGRAEAIGALCRIFCAKKSTEHILPVYTSRFYLVLKQILGRYSVIPEQDELLMVASILANSSDLFRVDMDGIQLLFPYFVEALELLLPERNLKMRNWNTGGLPDIAGTSGMGVGYSELRRSCIRLLLSLLPLPIHFQNLSIKEFGWNRNTTQQLNFAQFRPRLINLLINSLQIETDPYNTHLLLGGLVFMVQDAAAFEMQLQQQHVQCPQFEDSSDNDAGQPGVESSLGWSTAAPGNSSESLLMRSTYLVCHRLISSWKSELNISLAALELLSVFARIKLPYRTAPGEGSECCKSAVKWLCDFIVSQCSRPPPAHSKDLHSSIVAAFHCTGIWLLSYPELLTDHQCLNTLFEVLELGMSGTKSHRKTSDANTDTGLAPDSLGIKMKDDKELKPVSMRVRDAAEALLYLILEQADFGSDWSPLNLLDEVSLLKQCNLPASIAVDQRQQQMTYEEAISKFQYYFLDNDVLLAFLQEPLANDQDAQPTLTLLIRNGFGRQAWTMQLRHLPRNRTTGVAASTQKTSNSAAVPFSSTSLTRPVSLADSPIGSASQRYFPQSAYKIPSCKADNSIPSLESLNILEHEAVAEQKENNEIEGRNNDRLEILIKRQFEAEKNDRSSSLHSHNLNECTPPVTCHELHTTRMLLSHLTLFSNQQNEKWDGKCNAAVTAVRTDDARSFSDQLRALDDMNGRRTSDVCFVLYVATGQTKLRQILRNHDMLCGAEVTSTSYTSFSQLLSSLGWPPTCKRKPINVSSTKHKRSSFFPSHNEEINPSEVSQSSHKQEENRQLYWTDAVSEIRFIVPSHTSTNPNFKEPSQSGSDTDWYDRRNEKNKKIGEPETDVFPDGSSCRDKANSSNSTIHNTSVNTMSKSPRKVSNVVFLVWLENPEDYRTFPIDELDEWSKSYEQQNIDKEQGSHGQHVVFDCRPNVCSLIFVHEMQNALLSIKMHVPTQSRMNMAATPLVNGMVLSKRTAGPLIRQTVLNICRRRRLDCDSYQTGHVSRRLKLQEMRRKFECKMDMPQLFSHLFNAPFVPPGSSFPPTVAR